MVYKIMHFKILSKSQCEKIIHCSGAHVEEIHILLLTLEPDKTLGYGSHIIIVLLDII